MFSWGIEAIIASVLHVELRAVHIEARLTEDLHADSLDLVTLWAALENEFATLIPDAFNPLTVGDVLSYIRNNGTDVNSHSQP